MANEPASTKFEIELSPEMATLLRGLGVSPSTKISSSADLAIFSRIGSLAQQFGTASPALPALPNPTPVVNQMWCSSASRSQTDQTN